MQQQLAARTGWEHHDGKLPLIEGTLIRLYVGHLPGDRSPEPLWLWSSRAGTSASQVDRAWQAFLRKSSSRETANQQVSASPHRSQPNHGRSQVDTSGPRPTG